MADNINVRHDPTFNTVPVATDEIGGVHYPVYKMSYGADGVVTPISEANALPIVLQDPNDSTRQAEFDNLFKIPIMIDVAHHEVHEGDAYNVAHYDEDAASSHVVQLYVSTPATATPQKRIHLIEAHDSTGGHYVSITEGITYSAGGADFAPVNRNRGSIKTTSLQSFKKGSSKAGNVITYTGGTIIWDRWQGSGKTDGGEGRGTSEWILAPGTEYIFTIQSKAAGILLSIQLDWYEHTDA